MGPTGQQTRFFPRLVSTLFLAVLLGFSFIGVAYMVKSPDSTLSLVASLFSFSKEAISVTVSPTPAGSGSPIRITWTHDGRQTDGSYALAYLCRDGLSFSFGTTAVACNTPFPLGSATSVELTPQVTGADAVTVDLAVRFTPNGALQSTVSGSAAVTVNPASAAPLTVAATPTPAAHTPTPTPPTPAPTPAPQPVKNGRPDLRMKIIDVGILDSAGVFTHADTVKYTDQAAVVFEVTNVGTAKSEFWSFVGNLPIADGAYQYTSSLQAPLNPGDSVRFTIGFKNVLKPKENQAIFTIDPTNSLNDANRSNDYATATIVRSD